MNQYRVVRADGTDPGFGWMSLRAARAEAARLDRLSDHPDWQPYRVQRMAWEDVPEPEPLPDLPTEVWMAQVRGGGPITVSPWTAANYAKESHWRVFRGTITEWVEVTE